MPLGGADWYKEQLTNRNFLNPIGFILELEKFEFDKRRQYRK